VQVTEPLVDTVDHDQGLAHDGRSSGKRWHGPGGDVPTLPPWS
jgi:hypothetical protein